MTISVTSESRRKYEIDCDKDGKVMACFIETYTRLLDESGKEIAHKTHRDVVDVETIKAVVKSL